VCPARKTKSAKIASYLRASTLHARVSYLCIRLWAPVMVLHQEPLAVPLQFPLLLDRISTLKRSSEVSGLRGMDVVADQGLLQTIGSIVVPAAPHRDLRLIAMLCDIALQQIDFLVYIQCQPEES